MNFLISFIRKGTKCNSQEYCAYAEGLAYAWDNRRYFTFDVKGERFLNDTLSATLHSLKPLTLLRQDDDIFIGTKGKVYMYSLQNGALETLLDLHDKVQINSILCQTPNRIWVATEGNGLYLYDVKNKSWITIVMRISFPV